MSMAQAAPRHHRLEIDNLSVHFGNRSALDSVSLAIDERENVSLIGPNGSGKSTMLRVIAGVLPATHGEVRVGGQVVHRPVQSIVYIPQRSSVDWTFPVSVIDVVLMAMANRRSRLRGYTREDRDMALAALDRVRMHRFANVQIGTLSGGQQQRVFLARALLQEGTLYLLDEPFAGVDIPTQELLIDLFAGLRAEGKTIISATHDLTQAASSSDRVVLLNRRLVAEGPPSQVMTADNLRATFGGQAIIPVDMPVGGSAR